MEQGLIYAINREGEILGDQHGRLDQRRTIGMPRRTMDVLYFSSEFLDLVKKRGQLA